MGSEVYVNTNFEPDYYTGFQLWFCIKVSNFTCSL
jgi:hypothetical protein